VLRRQSIRLARPLQPDHRRLNASAIGDAAVAAPPPRVVTSRQPKDQSIETLRAIAVSLVVAFHIRGDAQVAGAADTYEWLAYTFRNVRIPLFTVISGYLYATRPVAAGTYGDFVLGKLRRLLLPMFCVATLEYLSRALLPGVSSPPPVADIWRIYVLPYSYFWFLQAVFLALLVVGALDARRRLESFDRWLLAILVGFLGLQLNPFGEGRIEPFSVGGFLFLLPYFLLGLGIHRFGSRLMAPRIVGIAGAVFAVSLSVLQANWLRGNTLIDSTKSGMWGLLFGVTGCLLLFRFRPSNKVLAWIGGFSFSIYLFQTFGSGFGRRLLEVPGINPHLYFLTLLLITIGVGIAIDLVVSRIPVARTLFLGKQ
jgi:glucan biosynthesis protein C